MLVVTLRLSTDWKQLYRKRLAVIATQSIKSFQDGKRLRKIAMLIGFSNRHLGRI